MDYKNLKELESLYILSLDFKDNFGEEDFNYLYSIYPGEVGEREQINKILLNKNIKKSKKIEEILIIQSFSKNRTIFHLSYEELLNIVLQLDNNNIPPTNYDFKRLKKLQELINLIKHDLITITGIKEKYTEFSFLSDYILMDPLEFYKKSNNISAINNMIECSEVIEYKSNLKKIRLNTFIKKIQNISYTEFKKERKNFEAIHGRKKYKHKLDYLENTIKFKLDPYCLKKLKELRKKNVISTIHWYDLADLQIHLPPIYWNRIPKLLWKGLKGEFKRIKRIKNPELKKLRISMFISRYIQYSSRLEKLL